MSMLFRTIKSIRSPPILPAKQSFISVNAAASSSTRPFPSVCIRRIHQLEQQSELALPNGLRHQDAQDVNTRGSQDGLQTTVDRVGLDSEKASGNDASKDGSKVVEDGDLPRRQEKGEDDPEWNEEAEEEDEIEYNDQVITYIHRLPPELDSITFRNFFWSKGIYVLEAWKATGKRSGIIQTSISDQELVCGTMDSTQAPWGILVAKPGDTASTMIHLSEADERAFQKASSQDSESSSTVNEIGDSGSKADSLDRTTDTSSERLAKKSPNNQSNELKQKLYLQQIPNMNTLQIDVDPKAEVSLSGEAVAKALTSRGYEVPACQVMDNRILIDVGNLSAEGLREILAKSHPTIKANVLEVVAFSWRSSFFSEPALYETNSETSLLITSLSPTISGQLVLKYLQALAPKLKPSSIKWIEKRVCETWAIVTVSDRQAFESVLNLHQQPIGGAPVDIRAMPIETKGSTKGFTKSAWDTFRIHNFPFNLTDDQVRNLFSSGEDGPTIRFIERLNPRSATFKIINPSPEARRELAAMQMSVFHGRAIHIENTSLQDSEKPDHNTSSIIDPQGSKFFKRVDGPDAGPRLLHRFRHGVNHDAEPVMGSDELIRTMKVFSPSCYTILKNAMEIICIVQELRTLQSEYVHAQKKGGSRKELNPQIIPGFSKLICESNTDLGFWRSIRYEVYISQKMKQYQQRMSQESAERAVRHTVAQALREIIYHPTHGIHALRPFDFNSLPKPPYRCALSKLFQRIVLQDPSVSVSMNALAPNPLSQFDQNAQEQQALNETRKTETTDALSNSERMLLRGRMRAFSPFFFQIFETYRKRSEISIYLQKLQQAYSQLEDKKSGDSEIVPRFHTRLWSILGNLGALVTLRTEVCQRIQKQKLDIVSVEIIRAAQIQAAKLYYGGLKEVIYHPTHGLDAKLSLDYRHPVIPPYQNELARRFQRDMTLVKISGTNSAELVDKISIVKDGPKKKVHVKEKPPPMISS